VSAVSAVSVVLVVLVVLAVLAVLAVPAVFPVLAVLAVLAVPAVLAVFPVPAVPAVLTVFAVLANVPDRRPVRRVVPRRRRPARRGRRATVLIARCVLRSEPATGPSSDSDTQLAIFRASTAHAPPRPTSSGLSGRRPGTAPSRSGCSTPRRPC
jgi:hypothetical protein